jgi:hypothetical protein
LTLSSLILGSSCAAACSYAGAIILQGPHQGAQKSTSNGISSRSMCFLKLGAETSSGWPVAFTAPGRFGLTRDRDAVGCFAGWTHDMQCLAHFMISVNRDITYIGLNIGFPSTWAGRRWSSSPVNRLALIPARLTGRDSSIGGRLW